MSAAARKYAALPDLDDAPDIFETPSLTTDTTTNPPSTAHASPPPSDDEASQTGISRSHLDHSSARARFTGSRVDASAADFSDRLAGSQPRSYVVHTRRRRRRQRKVAGSPAGSRSASASEDEDEDDGTAAGVRRKLARLGREAAEVRAELERLEEGGEGGGRDDGQELRRLDEQLGALNGAIAHGRPGAAARLAAKLGTKVQAAEEKEADEGDSKGGYTIAYAPGYDAGHALARAAAFDGRLAVLEAAMGLERMPFPTREDTVSTGAGTGPEFAKPVLPTLDLMDRQLATLGLMVSPGGATGGSLAEVQLRVERLTADAEKLVAKRVEAKNQHESMVESWRRRGEEGGQGRGAGANGLGIEDPETVAKVNALHGALPTIEALAPVLPGLLDRLRSLRLVHADAAASSQSLAALERRQEEIEGEIKEWRESLAKVEGLLEGDEGHVKENMQAVEGWVKELEERIKGL